MPEHTGSEAAFTRSFRRTGPMFFNPITACVEAM